MDIKALLDQKADQYNNVAFIETDPVSVPHLFTRKEDIEISGFLSATLAWGNRKQIIKSAMRLMQLMEYAPYQFIMEHGEDDLERFDGFVHRTFNREDLICFIRALRNIYSVHGGMEPIFTRYATPTSTQPAITQFRKLFFEMAHPVRSTKHLADPIAGSAAKRINMFLRWMVRDDDRGVDFGLWKNISPSQLSCPVDYHSGRIARDLGLLTRKQNDAKAVEELDKNLRLLDPVDPVRYDFALFGLGVFEE